MSRKREALLFDRSIYVAACDGAYTVRKARYAKGRWIVEAPSTTGLKTRAARLVSALGGKYVNREHGYHVSRRVAEQFLEWYPAGWDACVMTHKLYRPDLEAQPL